MFSVEFINFITQLNQYEVNSATKYSILAFILPYFILVYLKKFMQQLAGIKSEYKDFIKNDEELKKKIIIKENSANIPVQFQGNGLKKLFNNQLSLSRALNYCILTKNSYSSF